MTHPEDIIADIDESTTDLLESLSRFNDDQFNKKPADQSWSAAEVAEHLLLLETKVNQAMGRAIPTERAPDKKIEMMKDALRDPSRKLISPDIIQPSPSRKDRAKMVDLLRMQREILKEIVKSTNLTQTTEYKHPIIGRMTRLEWIYFNIYHVEKHVKQLERIAKEVGVNSMNEE